MEEGRSEVKMETGEIRRRLEMVTKGEQEGDETEMLKQTRRCKER